MQVFNTKNELANRIAGLKKEGKVIGFVPTMGALHEGHLSLVKASKKNSDITVVSIFVNPTQFNDPEDLKRYPRTLEQDIRLLETVDCDIVFAPSVEEIYPEPDTRKFDFGYLESVMEGAKRPGHFNGVGQVVSRLFDIVSPDKAFFGMKDFQQVAIIKYMVKQLKYNIEIIPCPIVREESGLAKSSRNTLLDEEHKKTAPHIYAT
ncbi:MAG: pantoate--beta-alanine ligase, partial [Odoribacter sp.]|nr:pantoate--beta-alanine ligase [Odoribacter sp.]